MATSEKQLLDALKAARATPADLKTALTAISHHLEESYILNLPPSKALLAAIEKLSQASATPASLKAKAKQLIRSYRV